MWAFEMENAELNLPLQAYQVSTAHIEQRAGMLVWGNLRGPEIDKEKNKIRSMWR